MGRASIVTDPMARQTRTEYFMDGQVWRITEALGTARERYARRNTYNGGGQLASVQSANGHTTTYHL